MYENCYIRSKKNLSEKTYFSLVFPHMKNDKEFNLASDINLKKEKKCKESLYSDFCIWMQWSIHAFCVVCTLHFTLPTTNREAAKQTHIQNRKLKIFCE